MAFQIFVDTLNFGPISLDVEASYTIAQMMKALRRRIDSFYEGFDIEVMLGYEQRVIYNGIELEDDKTLADYNIQKESTLRCVFGLVAGAPKVKKGWLKREDAVKVLRLRVQRPVVEQEYHAEIDVNAIGQTARAEIAGMKAAIDDSAFLPSAINQLSMERLNKTYNALDQPGSESTRKILAAIPHMSETYSKLTQCEEMIATLKLQYEQSVLDAATQHYVTYNETSGEANFNVKQLKKEVAKIKERKEIRAELEEERDAAAAADAGRCVVS